MDPDETDAASSSRVSTLWLPPLIDGLVLSLRVLLPLLPLLPEPAEQPRGGPERLVLPEDLPFRALRHNRHGPLLPHDVRDLHEPVLVDALPLHPGGERLPLVVEVEDPLRRVPHPPAPLLHQGRLHDPALHRAVLELPEPDHPLVRGQDRLVRGGDDLADLPELVDFHRG